jgi:hypothetical protein
VKNGEDKTENLKGKGEIIRQNVKQKGRKAK